MPPGKAAHDRVWYSCFSGNSADWPQKKSHGGHINESDAAMIIETMEKTKRYYSTAENSNTLK
jgi:hypothetical protein